MQEVLRHLIGLIKAVCKLDPGAKEKIINSLAD